MGSSALSALAALRLEFGQTAAVKRLRLIRQLSQHALSDPYEFIEYHELLLFHSAFPDSGRLRNAAERELARLGKISTKRCASESEWAEALEDSGIEGSLGRYAFGIEALRWIVTRYPESITLDWKRTSALNERLDDFLRAAVFRGLSDAVLNTSQTTEELLTRAAGPGGSALGFLCQNLGSRGGSFAKVTDEAISSLDMWALWRVQEVSRTLLRLPCRKMYLHSKGIRTLLATKELLLQPLARPRKLSRVSARRLIDKAMGALLSRGRETDPFTYANPEEVTLFHLEQGIDVVLYGLEPERRLPLDSYIGFLAVKNGIPVAYGGAWILGGRGEIGVNIFDTFRGADSAFLFGQILRVYHQYYGVTRFLVQPYQFGEGNEEGLTSGAFWFYHRLGFVPDSQALAKLAQSESEKRRRNSRYRTPLKVLKKLTGAKVVLTLGSESRDFDVSAIGLALTDYVGRRYHGDIARAESAGVKAIERVVSKGVVDRLPGAEKESLSRMSPLFLLASNAKPHGPALAEIFAKKGGRLERSYVQAVQKHAYFCHLLHELDLKGRSIAA